jgi:hypothetical protein
MPTITLSQEQYEALIALARAGVADNPQRVVWLEQWLRSIERQNGITRSFLMVQWQEISAPLPAGTSFPEVWPPRLRQSIEFVTRPVARADVDALLEEHATNPTEVLVTPDPNGELGWTPVDDYFVT